MQNTSRETESSKPITFVPTTVGFNDRGDLVVKAYFLNSGPANECVISLYLEVYSVINRINPKLVTSVSYNDLEIVVAPGEAKEKTFVIASVDREAIDYWRVMSKYTWQRAD